MGDFDQPPVGAYGLYCAGGSAGCEIDDGGPSPLEDQIPLEVIAQVGHEDGRGQPPSQREGLIGWYLQRIAEFGDYLGDSSQLASRRCTGSRL